MEGLIRAIAPQWALRRQLARLSLERLYSAAAPSNRRKTPTDTRSGNAVMDQARGKLRQWARHLDENHDLTHSILDTLANEASQVTIEPRARRGTGAPDETTNMRLRELWALHRDQLDSTGTLAWPQLAALLARSWLRDGECFAHHRVGVRGESGLGYTLTPLEADWVPFEAESEVPKVLHGVELSGAGRVVAYHVYIKHPGDSTLGAGYESATRRIPVEEMTHIKLVCRLGQLRGASILAPAITRLADVDDYEESERIAAKIAASLCAAITRGADFVSAATALDSASGERPFELQPGMLLDGLMPGEKVDVLDTNRPNPGLTEFRKSQLRAATAGIGVAYSRATHDYDGTYSSQRQELVESRLGYAVLREQFRAVMLRAVWRRFVDALIRDRQIQLPPGQAGSYEFEAIAPPAPWIDPAREASADEASIRMGTESRHGIIRRRGGDPRRVDDERSADTSATPAPAVPDDESSEEAA